MPTLFFDFFMRCFFSFLIFVCFVFPAFAEENSEEIVNIAISSVETEEWQKKFEKGKKRIAILQMKNAELQTPAIIDNTILCLENTTKEAFLDLGETPQKAYREWMKNCKYQVASIRIDLQKTTEKKAFFQKKYTRYENFSVPEWLQDSVLNEKMWDAKTKTLLGNIQNIHHTISTDDEILKTLGVQEFLGVGISKYTPSTAERMKNFVNAGKKLDGQLIHPNAEFSTLSTLSPFTEENGYGNGKVIVDGKIEDEMGGGICQTVTTLFRAWHNAGFLVQGTQPHSKSISFYGGIGLDATLYGEPNTAGSVDLKLKNNSNFSVLVKVAYKKGYQMIFLYGTKDRHSGLERLSVEKTKTKNTKTGKTEEKQVAKWIKTIKYFGGKTETLHFQQVQKVEK